MNRMTRGAAAWATACAATALLAGCSTLPPPIPKPEGPQSAALVMELKVRVSGIATYRADTVYFVRRCPECDGRLVSSGYAKDGRVYLLNAAPGEYRAVAASFASGMPGDSSLYFAYFPQALADETATRARPGTLSGAGSYLLSASLGLCPDNAEPEQLQHAETIEPGTVKCGFLRTLADKMAHSDYVMIGGKAYSTSRQVHHYRGTTYERLADAGSGAGFLDFAHKDLAGTGWEAFTAPAPAPALAP